MIDAFALHHLCEMRVDTPDCLRASSQVEHTSEWTTSSSDAAAAHKNEKKIRVVKANNGFVAKVNWMSLPETSSKKHKS